jgi:hypothetical protein
MAKAELKYGHNEQLRELAQQIIAKQQQEIVVMRDTMADGALAAARPSEQPYAELSAPWAPVDGSIAPDGMKMKTSR